MLRIIHTRTATKQNWTLCGQLTGPWVDELRTSWEQGHQGAIPERAIVDLSDVTFIDETGEKLLSEMRTRGAEFVAAGVETRHLLDNLSSPDKPPLRRSLSGRCGGKSRIY
jgi:anti-anti-sigma regulatory factor